MRWTNGARLLIAAGVCAAGLGVAQTQPQTPTEKPLIILIDAAHGGSDPGAILTPSVTEKDVTLAIARRLRSELNARGIPSQLVRDGDITLSADQRATLVNTTDSSSLYIALHASSAGSGIRVFTAMLPSNGDNKGPFLQWNTAQAPTLERSKLIQQQLIAAIRTTRFPTRALSAPLRPLNNVRTPALAIEISPTTGEAAQMGSAGYQAMVCSTLANALATIAPSLRANIGVRP